VLLRIKYQESLRTRRIYFVKQVRGSFPFGSVRKGCFLLLTLEESYCSRLARWYDVVVVQLH